MKEVTLRTPRVINGAVRYPVEGPIPVSDGEHGRLLDAGAIEIDGEDDLSALKVADLKQIAEDEGVDLGDATKKEDIIAAISAHRAAAK